jgi:hypothetical protein
MCLLEEPTLFRVIFGFVPVDGQDLAWILFGTVPFDVSGVPHEILKQFIGILLHNDEASRLDDEVG